MTRTKPPLFRKHNKVAANFHRITPKGKFRQHRNSKAMSVFEGKHLSIKRTREGFDYTPLFRFLLSKVGQNWNDIFSEAVGRLDRQGPVFWLVCLSYEPGDSGIVRIGESSYYQKLTVRNSILVIADPDAQPPAKLCSVARTRLMEYHINLIPVKPRYFRITAVE